LIKLIKAELVVAGILGGTLGAVAAPTTAAALASSLLKTGGKALKLAAKHPGKTLLAAGLATTRGGRKLLRELPKKIFKGGEILGKVVGGEDPGIGGGETLGKVGKALAVGGVVGAGAIVGKKIFDVVKGREEKKVEAPSLPGTRDVGAAPPQPVGLGGIPVAQKVPGALPGAPGAQKTPSPIQNIIQIAVR
jgi:hypothetical protein